MKNSILALLLCATTCLLAQAQTLVQSDDGTGVTTILFQTKVWSAPNIHYNANSAGWTEAPGVPLVQSTRDGFASTDGWWQIVLANTSTVEFVFNGDNVWDSNNGANYKTAAAGVYSVVSIITTTPAPTQAGSDPVLVAADDGTGLLTVLFQNKLWDSPNIHYNAFDGAGWTSVPGIAMSKSERAGYAATDGWWQYTLKTSKIEFVFNQNGLWDNNKNNNYKISAAGVWAVVSQVNETPAPPLPPYISGAGYSVKNVIQTRDRVVLQLEVRNNSNITEQYGADIVKLQVDVTKLKNSVRVKISDKTNKRWEVPLSLYGKDTGFVSNQQQGQGQQQGQSQSSGASNLDFTFTKEPFAFQVVRKSDQYVLFDSSKVDLIVKDQYLQLATSIQDDLNVYGLGESTRDSMRLSNGEKHTLWARDEGSMGKTVNTYGSHPFYLGLNGNGSAHGVLLHNSNGMDVTLQGGQLIYQTIGGILDLYVLAGPKPADVVSQYTALIGRPKLMPYWSYGWHQCRWGYSSAAKLAEVVAKYNENQLPLDVMWADIDYMNKFYDFTLGENFTKAEIGKVLDSIHAEGKKFVPIIDPGIPDDATDLAYKSGLEMDIFIKDTAGKPYLGQVWPGPTVFPDFFHPKANSYWNQQLQRMHDDLAYDGIWIDMNELANFCPGTTCARKEGVACPNAGGIDMITKCCLECVDDKNNTYNHPPFAINNGNGRDALFNKGIDTSALQYGGIRQYNSHNLYGLTEAIVTNANQEKILKKRSFVLSRSTFVGSGVHAAHWTGDNAATWNDIKWSIPTILNFGLFGIPMVGADICGFSGDSNAELCARWTALGSFYPFARNHNNIQSIPQETYVWPEVAEVGRKFIGVRYRLLPYLYTLGYQAHISGLPIARPMFLEFPGDATVRSGAALDYQFLLGDSLLVVPVLTKGATSVTGYLPAGTWYNLFDYSATESKGQQANWNVTLYDMPVFIRGGSILPLHQANQTTSAAARKTPFDLVVALQNGKASGSLYLDEGENLSGVEESTIVSFSAEKQKLTLKTESNKYRDAKSKTLKNVVVLGLTKAPTRVEVEGKKVPFTFAKDKLTLTIDLSQKKVSIVGNTAITWK